MLSDGLFSLLKTTGAITAILGTSRKDGSTGVFPVISQKKEPTLPYIVIKAISDDDNVRSFQGSNRLHVGARYRFECIGSNFRGARLVAKEVKALMVNYQGTLVDGSVVQDSWKADEKEDTWVEAQATLYGVILDFYITYVDND